MLKRHSKQAHLRESALDYAQESGSAGSPPENINLLQKAMDKQQQQRNIHHILSNIAELDTTSPVISDIIK